MQQIQTVTGPATTAQLKRILIHEHLMIGYPGWQSDSLANKKSRREMLAACVDKIQALQAHGVNCLVDPCPNDLGRDVEFMAEVSSLTGFYIVCATGLYKENEGGSAYWKFKINMGGADAIREMMEHEITNGIGSTGIKPGIIKVGSGSPEITDYENTVLKAAAAVSLSTGTPILSHTDHGLLGDEQQQRLMERGMPAHHLVVGHSCGSNDNDYHRRIADKGSYLAFDRFGLNMLQPDEQRVERLSQLIDQGYQNQLMVSHDSVWCWLGQPYPNPKVEAAMNKIWQPSHFFENIVPMLKAKGVSDETIEQLVNQNPKRFLSGQPLF